MSDSTFYVAGGTLSPDAPSYVPRAADTELLNALAAGELCYVLNARQLGKSSLCLRTRQALTARGIRTVFLDMQKFGSSATPEQWFNSLLQRIGLDLKLRAELLAYWRDNADRAPLDRLFGAITEAALPSQDSPLVIFLDEVDVVRSLPFSTDEFFGAIRECFNERAADPALRKLTFCLVGSALQADLVADTRLSPFNVGRQLDLRDFVRDELTPLAASLGPTGAVLIDRIYHWTGGHPFLTQSVCANVAASGASTIEAIDALVAEQFFTRTARRDVVHLADVANRMLSRKAGEVDPADDRQKSDILALYEQVWRGRKPVPDDARNPLVGLLKLSGIVRAEAGVLKVRNRIYNRVFDAVWIAENRPDAESRRQRAAVSRARWQVAGTALVILAMMGGLTAYALQNAVRADRERTNALRSAKAESEAKSDALRQAHEAELAKNQALSATSRAQTALRGELLAKATAQRNAALAQKSAAVALTEKRRAETQTQLANQNAGTAAKFNYDSCASLAQSAQDQSQFSTAAAYLGQMEELVKGSQHLDAGFELSYLKQQMHPERLEITSHHGPMTSICFSPDDRRILTTDQDKVAVVRDAISGKVVVRLIGHTNSTTSAAYFPDGKRILTGSADGSARIWDANTGRQLDAIRAGFGNVEGVAIFPDGDRILLGCVDKVDGSPVLTLRVWSVRAHKELTVCRGLDDEMRSWDIPSIAVSPDGLRVAGGNDTSFGKVWDAATGKLLTRSHFDSANATTVSFSPDSRRIVSGMSGSSAISACVWDAATGAEILRIKGHTGNVTRAIYSPDGRYILTSGSDTTARVWNANTGQEVYGLRGHLAGIRDVAFSHDGGRIATASMDGDTRIWDAEDGPGEAVFPQITLVSSVAFSPDGRRVAIGSTDSTTHVLDTTSGKQLCRVAGSNNPQKFKTADGGVFSTTVYRTHAAFSPDGKRIVTGSGFENPARVWNAATGKLLLTLSSPGPYVRSCAFSPDGKQIVAGCAYHTAQIWDAGTGRPVVRLTAKSGEIASITFSPDSRMVLATLADGFESSDGTTRLWDAKTGREIREFNIPDTSATAAAFSPDGKMIATAGSDNLIRLWDMSTAHVIRVLRGHSAYISVLVFSQNGKRLASAGGDETARLWDVSTGQEVLHLIPRSIDDGTGRLPTATGISSIALSPDDTRLIAGDWHGTVHLWDRPTPERVEERRKQAAAAERLAKQTAAENAAIAALTATPLPSLLPAADALLIKLPSRRADIALALNNAAYNIVDPARPRPSAADCATALQCAQRAVELTHRQVGDYLDTLAAAYLAAGDRASAIRIGAEAVSRSPKSDDLKKNLLQHYLELASYRDPDRWENDEKNLSVVLAQVPALAEARLYRADIRLLAGEMRGARADFSLLGHDFPDSVNPWSAYWPDLLVGDETAYRKLTLDKMHAATSGPFKEVDAAIVARRAALMPGLVTDYRPFLALARRAVDEAGKRAAKPQPDDDMTYYSYGAILLRAGRTAEAITALERAVALKPDRLWPMEFLVLAYAQKGDSVTARKWFDKEEEWMKTRFDTDFAGKENWSSRLQALLLRRQAMQALGIKQ